MADQAPLRNAPIVEAILDLRYGSEGRPSHSKLEALADQLSEQFPTRATRSSWSATVTVNPTQGEKIWGSEASEEPDGFLLHTADKQFALQIRRDGMALSFLPPYRDYQEFRARAKSLWKIVGPFVRVDKISRVALRYINRIMVPLPIEDFRDYFLTTPEIAPDLPQGLLSFFMQLHVPLDRPGCIVIMNQTIRPTAANPSVLPWILDIDAIWEGEIDANSEAVWERIDHLRDVKNDFFFKSITPRTRELFE